MKVLVMGHRRGITKSLEKMNITYLVWNEKPIINPLKAISIIESPFPESREDCEDVISDFSTITHVIAGVEAAVVPASKIRMWLALTRNPHGNILKCTNKLIMKRFLSEFNIPMTPFMSIKDASQKGLLIDILGTPFVCKPRTSSGGRGISFISTLSGIKESEFKDIYFEKPIKGKEGSIESLIKDGEVIFTNITEYQKSGFSNIVPASYSKDIQEKLLRLNKDVLKALNLKWGMTHLEFYITDDRQILFGEVAIRPPGGYIMEALALSYDINFWDLYVQIELHQECVKNIPLKGYSASLVFHPGEGIIKKIEGLEEVQELESVVKFKLKLSIGQTVHKREGVGEDFGHCLLHNVNQSKLLSDINNLNSNLKIKI